MLQGTKARVTASMTCAVIALALIGGPMAGSAFADDNAPQPTEKPCQLGDGSTGTWWVAPGTKIRVTYIDGSTGTMTCKDGVWVKDSRLVGAVALITVPVSAVVIRR